MKKFLPIILIAFTLVNFLTPFSVGINRDGIETKLKLLEAANCIVSDISFNPAGGLTKDTTVSLPSSIEATIKTQNCSGEKIDFWIKETTGIDSPVLKETLIVNGDTTVLKLNPTELECGGNNVCGFKYQVATKESGWAWISPNDIDTNYFYKCTSKDQTGNIICSNESPWISEIISGATKEETEKPEVNFKIKMTGTPTYTDRNVTTTIKVEDTTDYTSLGTAGFITYSYRINLFVKNEAGTIVSSKEVPYDSLVSKTIDPIILDIQPSTTYTLDGYINVIESTTINGLATNKTYKVASLDKTTTFTSNTSGDQTVKEADEISASAENNISASPSPMPACDILGRNGGTFMGCIAQMFYYILFVPTSYVFALAGSMFDWTFAYSVSDSSYRSVFVTQGWGIVRDICNMFFIFVLLYVAFMTILSPKRAKTQEIIINVIIIGLFINFSLFATELIIDTSNVLARVFYNDKAIHLNKNGGTKVDDVAENTANLYPTETDTIIPLSAGIVNKVNPQNLIINAGKIDDKATTDRDSAAVDEKANSEETLNARRFIIVTILATAVNVVGFMVFLTVALVFVTRVVGLWVAIILSPLAFFTYMVPKLRNQDTFGIDNWLKNTVSLAFVAPIFIFFLYIIIKFLEKGLGVLDATGKTGIDMIVATIVPFIFIIILLNKAKAMAVKFAGDFGKMVPDVGKMAGKALGGATIGLAAGGLAMAGRATVGKMADRIDKSDRVNRWAGSQNKFKSFIGNRLKDAGQGTAKSSFDVRSTKLVGQTLGKNVTNMGKSKKGGYVQDREDKIRRRQKRASELEVHEDEKLKQSLNKTEMDLQSLLSENKDELDRLDKLIEAKRLALKDANDVHGQGSDESKAAGKELEMAQAERREIRMGGKNVKKIRQVQKQVDTGLLDSAGNKIMRTETVNEEYEEFEKNDKYSLGTFIDENGEEQRRTIDYIERVELRDQKRAIEAESRKRRTNYANNITWLGGRANREAKHKIIMGSKIDSK